MEFSQFMVMVVISIVVSWVLHYGLHYHAVPGTKSFWGKTVIGYFGALWAGTIIGAWELIPGLSVFNVSIIPAILGSLAMIVFAVDAVETLRSWNKA